MLSRSSTLNNKTSREPLDELRWLAHSVEDGSSNVTGCGRPAVTATRGATPALISLCKLFTSAAFYFSSDTIGQCCAESMRAPSSSTSLCPRAQVERSLSSCSIPLLYHSYYPFVLVFLLHSFRIPLPICTITSLHYPFEHRYFLRFVYDSLRQTLFIQLFGPRMRSFVRSKTRS